MQVDRGSYPDAHTPWDDEAWRAEALDWIGAHLPVRETGPRRLRLRPWSIILRIEAAKPLWFKANPPGSAFEPALTARLAELVPQHVLTPYAVEPARGWSLLPDGGQVLKQVDRELRHWEELLTQYAEFQRTLIPHTTDFDRLGVPDARPGVLPKLFPEHADQKACDELAELGIPDTLDHADLHENQIFYGSRYTFFDWGDAVVSHPFCSLRVPVERAVEQLGPEVAPRLRAAYLEPWTADYDRATLERAADLA